MEEGRLGFTIITVCYNSEATIERTIKSVLGQSYTDFEYIIIDGGSDDGTLDIINKYRKNIDVLISEPDEGIYDAFNKGINLAKGEVIGILNSDDSYNPDTLEKVRNVVDSNNGMIVYGDTYFIDEKDVVFSSNTGHFDPVKLNSGIGFMHPSSFIPSKVYKSIGLYSTSKDLFIASDADFLLRCYQGGVEFVKGDHKVFMRTGGLSENSFRLAHTQYLYSLLKHDLITPATFKKEKIKLSFKSILKKFLDRKAIATIKLQIWIILVAAVNLLYRFLIFNFLKRSYLKGLGFTIGKSTYIHKPTFLSIGKFKVGDHTVINPNCVLDNRGEIVIGNNVSIGHYSKIYTTGHDVHCSFFTGVKRPVYIEDYVVLFSSCIVQPGVTIGQGSVIYPGSVVTRDIPPYSLVGGNPAKVIGKRNSELNYKLDYGFKFIK